MKKGWMRAMVAVSAMLWVGVALGADARPCARILFEQMPRLMLYGDTTRLGPKRPFAKDPTVIRHDGRYFMYYSECAYARNRIPKGMPKYRTGWWGAIATSTNLVDWSRVDSINVEGAPKTVEWFAPCVKKFDGKIHIFAQGRDLRGIDLPKGKAAGKLSNPRTVWVLWHATSDDGIHFRSETDKPAFIANNEWSISRAIDAEVYRVGDRMMLMFATREYPDAKIQQLGMAWANYGSSYSLADWHEISVKASFFKPEQPWEMKCIEAPTVIRRKGIWYMFYAGAYNHDHQQIGVAWSADGVNFKRWRDEPVFPHGPAGSWNAWESGHPGIFEDDDGQVYLFYQGKATLTGDYRLSCVKVRFED